MNNNLEWIDSNGNVTHTVPIGDSITTDEEILQATTQKNAYTVEEKEQAIKDLFVFSSIIIIIVLLLYIIAHQKH